ncbi:MAG: DUF3019 domain-containing protein [Gammaproteobacteria bacterium]
MSSRFVRVGLRAGRSAALALLCAIASGGAGAALDPPDEAIKLELSPRICTLAAGDNSCDTTVTAHWRAPRDESLCLLIVGQPQVKHCWENHLEGVYTVRLEFSQDLLVELRDPQLQKVLASEAIAVIREALRLRHRRRQPWDILS